MNKMNRSAAKAYATIRGKILSAEFQAGAALSTKHLAEEIGVSRTPVRDALRELETEGLVVLSPRQEARVKSATFEEFRDLCELRVALEAHGSALAAERRTGEELESMKQSLESMRELVSELSKTDNEQQIFGKIALEDIRFHTAVIDAARNKALKDEMHRFQIIVKVVNARAGPYKNNPLDVWESHLQIFEAIRLQEREKAKKAMEDHLEEGMRAQLKALKQTETDEMTQYL